MSMICLEERSTNNKNNLTMTKKEFLREVFTKYNLNKDEDIFALHGTAIITKTGIQKIVAAENMLYRFEVIKCEPDYCAVLCKVSTDGGSITAESFGSAEKANVKNTQKYYLEMSEKRAKARAVLIAIGAHGMIYSEDEADEFKKQ